MKTKEVESERREEVHGESEPHLGERGAKAVLTTGLIIAYGINSLATSLAASTYYLRPCCSLSWRSWKRRTASRIQARAWLRKERNSSERRTRHAHSRTDH
jgi:hypothetical protein